MAAFNVPQLKWGWVWNLFNNIAKFVNKPQSDSEAAGHVVYWMQYKHAKIQVFRLHPSFRTNVCYHVVQGYLLSVSCRQKYLATMWISDSDLTLKPGGGGSVLKQRVSFRKGGRETCHGAVTAVGDLCWPDTLTAGRKTGSQPAPSGGSTHGTFAFPENDPHFERRAIEDDTPRLGFSIVPRLILC